MFSLVSCFIAEVKITKKTRNKEDPCDKTVFIPDGLYISKDIRGDAVLSKGNNIRFLMGSSNLDKSDLKTIKQIYDFMITNEDIKLIIEGHADSRGSNAKEKNYPLSLARANNVYTNMLSLGINKKRLYTFAYSDYVPRYKYKKYRNRRTDFIIIKCDKDFIKYEEYYNTIFSNVTNVK